VRDIMKRGTMVRFYYPDYISEDNAEVNVSQKINYRPSSSVWTNNQFYSKYLK
jgi:hypothetical protein